MAAGSCEHERALAEIVERQRRKHQHQPGGLDRGAAEMAEIGIKRLGSGHREEHRAQRDQPDDAVAEQERDPVVAD